MVYNNIKYPPCVSCGGDMVSDGFGTGKCLPCRAKDTADILSPPHDEGICIRCKTPLKFSVIPTGNCQPSPTFVFHRKGREYGEYLPGNYNYISIFHGLWAKLEWEASLCDRCLNSLSDWLLGEGWRKKEAQKCKTLTCDGRMIKKEGWYGDGSDGMWVYECDKGCGSQVRGNID